MPERNVIKKILIIRLSSLGDIIMATAMIRALRTQYPESQIDMAVRSDFIDLISDNPHLNSKISLDRKSGIRGLYSFFKQVNSEKYDLIYDAHRSLRSVLLMPFLKAKQKIYFKKHYLKRNLSLIFKFKWLSSLRTLERYIEPLHTLGVRYDGKGPELFIASTTATNAIQRFPFLTKEKIRVGLIPSAQWPGKRWPLSNFKKLIELLVQSTSHEYFVFGGKEDSFCEDLTANMPKNRVINFQGILNLKEVTYLLSCCKMVVANDTGLMHMADALNIPSLLFLGPTSKELGCLPFHPKSRILEHKLWCRPCSKNGQAPCIRKERYCLTLTTTQMAFEEFKIMDSELK